MKSVNECWGLICAERVSAHIALGSEDKNWTSKTLALILPPFSPSLFWFNSGRRVQEVREEDE